MQQNGNIGIGTHNTNYFTVNENGNVGVGTDEPAAKLEVKGTNNTHLIKLIDNENTRLVVNCNNIAHEDNYAYPSYAFLDAINNPPYYSSGSFNLDSEVNTLVNENTTIFTACNEIILSNGFKTGNKPFIATVYGFADCYSAEVTNESKAIAESTLMHCDVFPNPFKICSNIELNLPNSSNIKIDIYDLNGNFITNILSNNLFSGDYNIDIDLKNHPPGIYYLRILENNLDFKTIKLTKM